MINKIVVNVIITAAGLGKRMKSNTNKQFLKIGKKIVLERTISKFLASKYVDNIYLVAKKEKFEFIKQEILSKLDNKKNISLVEGGETREESTLKGINAIDSTVESVILTHDGARPFVKTGLIDEIIENVLEKEAVICAVPEVDTVKVVKDQKVLNTLERKSIYRVQTPQAFKSSILIDAYDKYYGEEGITDDSSLVEMLGYSPYVILGSYENIKITNQEDIIISKALAQEEDNENR